MSWIRCFSSLGCPGLTLDETLALAARHDIPAIELRALDGTVDLARYFAAAFGTPVGLAERMRSAPARILALDASLRLVGGTAVEREELAALAPWADAAGARWLRVFDGGKTADAGEVDEAKDTLAWWQELRVRHSWRVDIMVETHDSLFTAETIGRLLRACPSAVILWDAHHTWRKGGEDPAVTWRAIRPRVIHVHVKDSIPLPSARHPFTYVLPGDGGFPMAAVLKTLRRDRYAGAVSLEWEKLWHPYLPSLQDALETAGSRKWW